MADSSKVTSMAELLAKHQSTFVTLHRGDVVKAKVSKVTPTEILLEVGAKTEAVVMEKDRKIMKHLVSLLKVGDTVEAMVLNPESDMGYPMMSLRHFAEDKTWTLLEELLKSQEKVDVTVTEATKGGFLVESASGVNGFLPNSHLSPNTDTDELVGSHIKASVVDLNRQQNKVIFSEKGMMTDEDFKKATASLKEGQKMTGTISGITSFGLFVPLPLSGEKFLDGLVHISEVSWERMSDLSQVFAVGQEVEVMVIGFDTDNKRVDLSIKRLSADPFKAILEAYPADKKVTGTITDINEQGVDLELPAVEGMKVLGTIRKEKISPNTKYEVGQEVQVTVVSVDQKKRKVLLTPVLKEKPLMYR